MEKIQMQIQFPKETMEALRAAAERWGVTPNIFARLLLQANFAMQDVDQIMSDLLERVHSA